MARYEHIPIYKATFDLACEAERAVRAFSRYNKYTLWTDLRDRSRALVDTVIKASGGGTWREPRGFAPVTVRLARPVLFVPSRPCAPASPPDRHEASGSLFWPNLPQDGSLPDRSCTMKRTLARILHLAHVTAVAVLVLGVASPLQAQTGNIDPTQRHSWGENAGWLDLRPLFGLSLIHI